MIQTLINQRVMEEAVQESGEESGKSSMANYFIMLAYFWANR